MNGNGRLRALADVDAKVLRADRQFEEATAVAEMGSTQNQTHFCFLLLEWSIQNRGEQSIVGGQYNNMANAHMGSSMSSVITESRSGIRF